MIRPCGSRLAVSLRSPARAFARAVLLKGLAMSRAAHLVEGPPAGTPAPGRCRPLALSGALVVALLVPIGGASPTAQASPPAAAALAAPLAAAPAPQTAVTATAPRTLRQGMRGADVRALQTRLRAVKADVGPITGYFGSNTRHGLVAFQKSQGLPRTGVYDRTTRARLAAPRPIRLRYPARGRAVEVDIRKQVLYLSNAGKLVKIVDVSTGNGRRYTVDGRTSTAITPTGRFRIQRKINGVRVARLGRLYRPAYFYRGYAIHGSPSVPTYPASHGCVRVTNPAMDRLYSQLPIGTPIALYRR